MRSPNTLVLAASLIIVVFVGPAMADDLYPPSWRGQNGTTMQVWEFSDPNPTPPPDPMVNPYGTPQAQVWTGIGHGWMDEWGNSQGMWPLSGTIEIWIPNRPQPLPFKDIWVQLTWTKQVSSSRPKVWEFASGVIGTEVQRTVLGPTGLPAPYDTWYHSVFLIHLEPNPYWEIVKVDGTLVVDEIVVDTICYPEPATAGLLLLGGLALLRRRKA
ncbi:MAG: PEP-CTERM sorting domain-containing protein [Planctomycetes bacterium]|nr:PEP-CTERM sorting domain-containing protein [Planctomycetota bacterium]